MSNYKKVKEETESTTNFQLSDHKLNKFNQQVLVNNKIYDDIHVGLESISDWVFHLVYEVIEMDKEEAEELENSFKHLKTLLGCYKDNFEHTITLWNSSNATNLEHLPDDKRLDLMCNKEEAVSEFINYWINLKQPIEKLSPSGFVSEL